MGLDSDARMNEPSTVGGNWRWRIDGGCINDWLAQIIYENTKIYCRLPVDPTAKKSKNSSDTDEKTATTKRIKTNKTEK